MYRLSLTAAAIAMLLESTGVASAATVEEDRVAEAVVTGSRLRTSAAQAPPELHVFSSDEIAQSGQRSLSEFLNTLSFVSTAVTESGTGGQTAFGATTVSLRGLPLGTTLVLINGRRVEPSGSQSQGDFFDLNAIPLAVIERVEVIADGSSAVYGSDAIGGVVNVILRKDVTGVEATAQYGHASKLNEQNVGFAAGRTWNRANLSIVGSYQQRGELLTDDRALTRSNDYRAFGGADNNFPICNPGNVFSVDGAPLPNAPAGNAATFASIPALASSVSPSLSEFGYGELNKCSLTTGISLIPPTHRWGLFAQLSYPLSSSTEFFFEMMYSHVRQEQSIGPESLFGLDGFQIYSVGAANPYNPFGETVGIALSLPTIRQQFITDTDFARPLLGLRGALANDWSWEITGFQSQDRTQNPQTHVLPDSAAIQDALNSADPRTALNPFVALTPASTAQWQGFFSDALRRYVGRERSVSGWVRGELLQSPAGPVAAVLGSEYSERDLIVKTINDGFSPPNTRAAYQRDSFSLFAETRIPIVRARDPSSDADRVALRLAARRDHSSDFGAKTTPQLGLEWHPGASLLFNAGYAQSYKAPSLPDLHSPVVISPLNAVTDPQTGETVIVQTMAGGNSSLRPLSGASHTLGMTYQSRSFPAPKLFAMYWRIKERDAIQSVFPQFIVDHEREFPDRVTRGVDGAITSVNSTRVNFGSYTVSGLDYGLTYPLFSKLAECTASIVMTQTLRYDQQLVPGDAVVDAVGFAQSSGAWAPRWKGRAAFDWSQRRYGFHLATRYTGGYRDYDGVHELSDFWITDLNLRYDVGQTLSGASAAWKDSYIEAGGVNVFNRTPSFSTFGSGFVGYDPGQADIRGRLLYAKLGFKW